MDKRTVAVFVISIVMVLSLSACGSRSNDTTTKVLSDAAPTSASVINTTTTTPSDTTPATSSDTDTATITPTSTVTCSGSSEKNIDYLNNTLNQDKGAEWKAYSSILSGDFTLIEDSDYKSEMEFLYTAATQNGKCGWKYILMGFNKDGVNDLFIQLDSEHNSAFFSYSDGKVKSISIDDLEATCYLQPLKDGKLLEIYDYWIAPTKSVYELDSEFMPVNLIQYISMTVDDYKDFKESYAAIMDEFPTIKKEGVYYFQEIYGMQTSLLAEKWEQIQMDIEGQLIPDNEWRDCSELSSNSKLEIKSKADNAAETATVKSIIESYFERYFYNNETAEYVQYYTSPTFASKTSTDGKLRIESVGMYQDGPSGLFALKEMRIINTSNADVLWSNNSYLSNGFMWSEDNRFVTATYSGRQWVQTDIIDTKDYTIITIPDIDDILKASPNAAKPSDNDPMPIFQAVNWVTPSVILIHFEWCAENNTSVLGEYEYDLDDKKMDIKEIKSIQVG